MAIVNQPTKTDRDVAYRFKSVTPGFSAKLNGERNGEQKSSSTGGTRVERDQAKVQAILEKQEEAQDNVDSMRRLGFDTLASIKSNQAGLIDWKQCVASVTEDDITAWAKWRGRTRESIQLFVDRGCYGKYEGCFALPLRDPRSGNLIGVKTRPDLKDKGWRIYPLGAPNLPIIIGDPKTAQMLLVGESPFDLHRVIDELNFLYNSMPWCAVCTQGSGNAKAIDDIFPRGIKVFAIMQNDDPAAQWFSDLSSHLMRPLHILRTPRDVNEGRKEGDKINDIDDWFRFGGATHDQFMEQVNLAIQFVNKPVLILPSAGVEISSTAKTMYGGYNKLQTRFVRNNEFVVPWQTDQGRILHVTSPAELCSDVEKDFDLQQWTPGGVQTPPMLVPHRLNSAVATQLLGASEKRTESLPLRIISALPFLAQGDGNNTLFLGKGYHPEVGGVYVDQDLQVPELPLPEAVNLLTNGLFADFSFVSPSDRSRAIAQLISPALKLGGFLGKADFPCNIAIADQSQSGKTHLMKIITQVYGERPYVVINKAQRGVGSLDESMASALRSGKLFILCDNVRGQFESQLLESALRGVCHVPVRVPGFGEIIVRTDRVLMQLTSNQADLPTDLTNRSIITSVRKPPKYHHPKLPWGEEFLVYIDQRRALYLAAIHTIVREWVRHGKPHTNDRRHDFREWCQSLDWIVRNIFNLPPLLDGHREMQRHLSNKTWGWFRAVVLLAAQEKKLGVALSATNFVSLGNSHSVRMPNIKEDASDEALVKHAGKLLGEVFSDDEDVSFVDEFQVDRSMEKDLRQGRANKKYTISLRPDSSVSRTVTTEAKPKPEPAVETTVIDNPPIANINNAPVAPYVYVTKRSQLEEVITDLSKEGAIALDLETYYPHAKLTKLGKRRKTAVDIVVDRFLSKIRLLQLYREGSEQVWLIDCKSIEKESDAGLDQLREILGKRTIVGHGICTFDLPWLWAHYQIRASKIVDTLTISKLTTGGAPPAMISNDLESVLERIGVNLPKDQGDSDWGVEELSPEQLSYAAGDVYFLHQIVSLHEQLLEGDGMGAVWALEKELAPVIVDMSNRGMSFDVDSTGPVSADIAKRMAAAEKAAVEWFAVPNLNIASPRQLLEAFQTKGVRLDSVDEKNLSECKSAGAKLVLDFRRIQNRESKFLASLVLLTRHGRIHGVFDPVGARSGRIICKKPNLQQIPKRGLDENQFPIRTLFRAAPGKKLIISDFSQMELVAIASLHEPVMLEALKNGVDLHVHTAELVLDKTDVSKDDRQLAKATNFGLCFGQAAQGFQQYAKLKYGIDLSFRQAESLRERFFDAYPGLQSWHEAARRDADSAVEARTVLGRRTWLGDSWWSRFAGLLNHHIQGSCSDVLKLALVELDQKLAGIAKLCLCVHDEILLEADEMNAEQAQKVLDETMVSCFQCIFPDAPIAVESRIADAWQE